MAQIQQWTKPSAGNVVFETLTDVFRPKPELVLENALLRQQVIVLRRKVKHPQLTNTDRRVLVVLTSRVRAWRRALLVFSLRRHCNGTATCSSWCGATNCVPG